MTDRHQFMQKCGVISLTISVVIIVVIFVVLGFGFYLMELIS